MNRPNLACTQRKEKNYKATDMQRDHTFKTLAHFKKKKIPTDQLVQSAQKNFFIRQSRALSQFDESRITEERDDFLKIILQKFKTDVTFGIIK